MIYGNAFALFKQNQLHITFFGVQINIEVLQYYIILYHIGDTLLLCILRFHLTFAIS